jgi:putative transposase
MSEFQASCTCCPKVAVFFLLSRKVIMGGLISVNGQKVNDNVMGMITALTQYKAKLNGAVYHEIARFVKSSGICCECKYEHKFDLSVINFACESCGTVQCKDLSAAKSVANTGENDHCLLLKIIYRLIQ